MLKPNEQENCTWGRIHSYPGLKWVWAYEHIASSRPFLLVGIWLLATTTLDQCELRSWTSLPLQREGCNRAAGKGGSPKFKTKKPYAFLGRKIALLKEVLLHSYISKFLLISEKNIYFIKIAITFKCIFVSTGAISQNLALLISPIMFS